MQFQRQSVVNRLGTLIIISISLSTPGQRLRHDIVVVVVFVVVVVGGGGGGGGGGGRFYTALSSALGPTHFTSM